MKKIAVTAAAGFLMAAGIVASTATAARADEPCANPTWADADRAYNETTGYSVDSPYGEIRLRHGLIKAGSQCIPAPYVWAAVAHATDDSKIIVMEVDRTGDKRADTYTARWMSDMHWTSAHINSSNKATYVRACVKSSSSGGCLSGATTSWWPVG